MPPQDGPSSCLVAPRTHHLLELSPSSSLPPASHSALGSCSSSHYYLEAWSLRASLSSHFLKTVHHFDPLNQSAPRTVGCDSSKWSRQKLKRVNFIELLKERERERRPEYLGHFFLIFVAKRRLTKVLFK